MRKLLLGLIGLLFAVPAVAATLPAGYTELEYIESTGGQWIDTGVELSFADINFDIKFEFVSTQDTQGIFGYLDNSISTTNFYLTKSSTNTKFIFASGTSAQTISYSVQSATPYTIVLNDSNLKINGTSFNVSRGNLSSGNEIYLFNRNNSGNFFVGKIYYFKIYNGDTLVRNFIPAQQGTTIGLYDTVSQTFFTNQGTGEFIAGPVIPEQQIRIATTAYNSARFSPVVTELNDTIATIRDVVTNTINQTKAIADLQATKQTRPDETCPAGKKCLLVEDDAGQPHWYEIVESAEVQ